MHEPVEQCAAQRDCPLLCRAISRLFQIAIANTCDFVLRKYHLILILKKMVFSWADLV